MPNRHSGEQGDVQGLIANIDRSVTYYHLCVHCGCMWEACLDTMVSSQLGAVLQR